MQDGNDVERRAIAYIAKMPPAIQGQNGSADAMRVANKFYEFGLDIESARRIFIEHYNPRCVPQWNIKEIDHKLDSAYGKPIRDFGEKLHQQNDQYHIRHAINEFKEKYLHADSAPACSESAKKSGKPSKKNTAARPILILKLTKLAQKQMHHNPFEAKV